MLAICFTYKLNMLLNCELYFVLRALIRVGVSVYYEFKYSVIFALCVVKSANNRYYFYFQRRFRLVKKNLKQSLEEEIM